MQEYVLFVLGDMHGALSVAFGRMFVSPSGRWRRRPKRRQDQVELLEREDEVWKTGEA